MKTDEQVRPTRALRAPRSIPAAELRLRRLDGDAPPVVDVREAAAFHSRHIAGAHHGPDSQTTALVKKIQTMPNAVLVCEDGRVSAMVTRTLGLCGFYEISFLEGGLAAWAKSGGKLVETTRSGFEHELAPEPEPVSASPSGGGREEGPLRSWFVVLRSWFGSTSARPDTGSTRCG